MRRKALQKAKHDRRAPALGASLGRLRFVPLAPAAREDEASRSISRLPVSLRILLESVLRNLDGRRIRDEDVEALARWQPNAARTAEVPFVVGRVLLQDFTGVPLLVDLAAMRSAVARRGGDVARVQPLVPVDLVIDHSVQVDYFGRARRAPAQHGDGVPPQRRALPVPQVGERRHSTACGSCRRGSASATR